MLISNDHSKEQAAVAQLASNLHLSAIDTSTVTNDLDQPLIWQVNPTAIAPAFLLNYPKLVLYVPHLPHDLAAWLPVFQNARAIITGNGRVNAFLNEKGIDSSKLIARQLPFYPFGRPFYQQPPFNRRLITETELASPVQVEQWNSQGGLGVLRTTNPYDYPTMLGPFLAAQIPVIAPKGTAVAELVSHYQIGCVYDVANQDLPTVAAQVNAQEYQTWTANIAQITERVTKGQDLLLALSKARQRYAGVLPHWLNEDHPDFNIHIMDNDHTLDYIAKHHCSVARLGDGEIYMIFGYGAVFQPVDRDLQQRLLDILVQGSNDKLLVCMSDAFHDRERFVFKTMRWWDYQVQEQLFHNLYTNLGQENNTYGNTMVTRPYIDLLDRSRTGNVFDRIKQWWQDRDLLIVEGKYTRSGVHNDLYDNARSVSRILCPPHNAWAKHEQIEAMIKKYGQGKLVLVMLGMAATVIAADLADWGQVIDSGHLDSEYEWYRQNAQKRVRINNKHTAEQNEDYAVTVENDPTYQSQIIADISGIKD